jgi:CRP-like cAMP-binding protein
VRLTQEAPNGKQVVVELLGPGDCTGLLATLGQVPHPFSCLALTDVEALEINSDAWRDATYSDPELLRKATSTAIPRMLGGYGFMAAMATGDVNARLALALLRLDDINARTHGPATPIHLTRKALAEIGVTTVESAIRITSQWNKSGTIRTAHKSLTVLNRSKLYSIAQLAVSNKDLRSDGVLTPLHQSG